MNITLLGCRFGNRIIYQKYVTCTMVLLSLTLLYGIRQALPISLPNLIIKAGDKNSSTNGTRIRWSSGEDYYVSTCFYVGYIVSQVPVGAFCDMYGAKHFLSVGVLSTGLINVATPYVILNAPWYYAAILQFTLGVTQGICMPALISLMSKWVPERQITFLITYGYSGGCLGTMVCYLMSSVLIEYFGKWQYLFMFWAALSVIWYLIFVYLVFSRPSVHPFVCIDEKLEMLNELGDDMPKHIPWGPILSDSAVWALVAGQFGHTFLHYMVDTNLSRMFKDTGTSVSKSAYIVIMPYICQWGSTIGTSYLGNYLVKNKYIPVVYVRSIYVVIGNILPCFFALIATHVIDENLALMGCLLAAMVCKGTIFAGLKTNILDISRHYSGCVQGLHNGIASIVGVLAPQVTKFMINTGTIQEWRKVVLLAIALSIFATTLFFLWAKGDRGVWDVVDVDHQNRYDRPRRTSTTSY